MRKPRRADCGCCDPSWFDWMMAGLGWLLVAMWIANRLTSGCLHLL